MANTLHEIALYDRRGTNSLKWDGLQKIFGDTGLLPAWVADMDFKPPSCVGDAIRAAAQHAFGYYLPPEEYFESFIHWESSRHGYRVERNWIRTSTGVVSSIYQLIGALTCPNDAILIQPPVYYPFMNAIRNTGRTLVTSELILREGRYSFDDAEFEEKIKEHQVKLFLLCSPHNPVGRVWSREELEQMVLICKRHGVIILSDEIHHDFVHGTHRHLPTAAVGAYSHRVITLTSASKTFNLAGMKNSFVVIENEELRFAYDQYCVSVGATISSTLDYAAVTAAYTHGEAWLNTVLSEIYGNYNILLQELAPFPNLTVAPLEGTYLAWIDLGAYVSGDEMQAFLQKACGLALDYGSWFTPNRLPSEDTHARINLAAPQQTIRKVAARITGALRRQMSRKK